MEVKIRMPVVVHDAEHDTLDKQVGLGPEGGSTEERKAMTLRDIRDILDADVLCGEHLLDREVKTGFACDLISEMLASASSGTLLITSLKNPHVVHTAEVMDAVGVVLVGGKGPNLSAMKEASSSRIPLLATDLLIFKCCGLLFQHGVQGCKRDCLQ
jgi:predicted transcriptional regulator